MATFISPYSAALQEELKPHAAGQPRDVRSLAGASEAIILNSARPDLEDGAALVQRFRHMAASGSAVSLIDFERVLGKNDLVSVNYLKRGVAAARSVVRVHIGGPDGLEGWGTGFMVAPRLLLTNNHVLGSFEQAGSSVVEFGYEADVSAEAERSFMFALEPQHGFITDAELDFTLVTVAERSRDGSRALADFGFLRLNPATHKVVEDECVSIIQHPEGKPKCVTVRENKVVKIGDRSGGSADNFLWYTTDTQPGSSGSPVFNDQWQVVALHHSSVPKMRQRDGVTEYALINDEWVTWERLAGRLPSEIVWIANEGIRVSKVVAKIADLHARAGAEASPFVQKLLDDAQARQALTSARPIGSVAVPPVLSPDRASELFAPERARTPGRHVRPLESYADRRGYDPDFLGVRLPLPRLTPDALRFGRPAPVRGASDNVLRYTHFSLVLNQDRRLAFFTAVNIDGARLVDLRRGDDDWSYDPRVAIEHQVGDELYGNEPQGNWFDRGHLVRRRDPVWGDSRTAALANQDTFHFTNAAPQYWRFNQSGELWQGLENFILFNTDAENLLTSVFTGPIFQDDDELHRGVHIPQFYWKVVAVRERSGRLLASAYVVSQQRHAKNIPFEALPVGPLHGFQIALGELERRTGLEFPEALRAADVFSPGWSSRGIANGQPAHR